MPFRAIIITLVTVMLALLAAGMWVRSISPLLAEVNASTQPSTEPGASHPAISFPTTSSTQADRPDKQFKDIVKAFMIITFLIVFALFVIGFVTTLRAWMRTTKSKRTRYVDAWKIAGERLAAKDEEEGLEGKATDEK